MGARARRPAEGPRLTPRISVIIPCRDDGQTLPACLDALRAQDLAPELYEIIVVDPAPERWGPGELPRLRILADSKRGPSAARNVGIAAAEGAIVAFTDADCIPRSDWLSSIAEVFADHPGIAGVAGALRMPTRTLPGRLGDLDARVHYRGFITSNVAYLRDALLDIGGFDETLHCAEDYDLAWRLMDAGHRIVHDGRPVVVHDPPEIGTVPSYLAKEFWYARGDVRANLRALRRARRGGTIGSLTAAEGFRGALIDVALAAGTATLPLSPRLGLAALTATFGRSAYDQLATARAAGEGDADLAPLVALRLARRLVRGAGTVAGLAQLVLTRGLSDGTAPAAPAPRASRAAVATPARR